MQDQPYSPVRTVAVAAVIATVALTGAAFWLSYEHLAEVASSHGLKGARAWAWPATIDLFIVIGELLVLRASLQGERDPWAIGVAAAGSFGSIALNVAGVRQGASNLEYVVAGVPPVAALLAFGVLMRQVHRALKKQDASSPEIAPSSPLQEGVESLQSQVGEPWDTEWAEPLQTPPAPPEELLEVPQEALEAEPIDQETLVEKLVASGEPLPGRATVAAMYGVTDWVARQALREAKERLQEAKAALQADRQIATTTKENS